MKMKTKKKEDRKIELEIQLLDACWSLEYLSYKLSK